MSTIKKTAFTVLSIPLAYNTWWAYNWQTGRK